MRCMPPCCTMLCHPMCRSPCRAGPPTAAATAKCTPISQQRLLHLLACRVRGHTSHTLCNMFLHCLHSSRLSLRSTVSQQVCCRAAPTLCKRRLSGPAGSSLSRLLLHIGASHRYLSTGNTSIWDSVQDRLLCQLALWGPTYPSAGLVRPAPGGPARHTSAYLPCRVEAPMATPAQATPAASAAPVTLPQTAAAAWPPFCAAPSATTASLKGTAMTPTVYGELGCLAKQLTLQASPHELTQGFVALHLQ